MSSTGINSTTTISIITKKQAFRDYKKYKKYQKKHLKSLDCVDNYELSQFKTEDLMRMYFHVEKMYTMRTLYREQYYTKDTWDTGHTKFITYLVLNMEKYIIELSSRFQKTIHDTKPLQNTEITEVPEIMEVRNTEQLSQTIETMKLENEHRRQSELKLWNVEIPKLIKERNLDFQHRIQKVMQIKKILNITNEQCIDIIQFIVICYFATQKRTGYASKRIKPWKVHAYSTNLEEYLDTITLEHITSICEVISSVKEAPMLKNFLQNILNITSKTNEYYVFQCIIDGLVVMFPHTASDTLRLKTSGKTTIFVEKGDSNSTFHVGLYFFEKDVDFSSYMVATKPSR